MKKIMCKIIITMAIFSASVSAGSFSMEDYQKAKPDADFSKKAEPIVIDFPAAILLKANEIKKYEGKILEIQEKIKQLMEPVLKSNGLDSQLKQLESKRDGFKVKEGLLRARFVKDNNVFNKYNYESATKRKKLFESKALEVKKKILAIEKSVLKLNTSLKMYDRLIKKSKSKIVIYKEQIMESESK